MNPPQVYLCSPSWTLLPPPSPYPPSGSSQCTSPKHPVSCIEPGLETRFIHDIIHVSVPLHLLSNAFLTGFPDSSVGKESACNAGDPGSIPGLGRSTGEGIGCPLQYSWASLVAQLVKKPPAMWETWVQSLGWEDSLEKGKVTHSSVLAWRIPWTV